MIVYHGSSSNFKKLRISKSLVKHSSTLENEGLGIYFSTDYSVADSYGKYLYVLEVNDKYVIDFRKKAVCYKYLQDIVRDCYKVSGVDISRFADIRLIADSMSYGGVCICNTCSEVYLHLDSNENWYIYLNEASRNKVQSFLRTYDKKHLFVYMFPYNIQGCGIIKSVDENIVRIVEKRSR